MSRTAEFTSAEGFTIREVGPRRGVADALVERLLADGRLSVERAWELVPEGRRGAVAVTLSADAAPDEALVVLVRHASGAVTFHPALGSGARRRFDLSLASLLGRAVRVLLLKALTALADAFLPRLALSWETAQLEKRGISEGWLEVTPAELAEGTLTRRADLSRLPPAPARSLLLVHGLLSDTASAFGRLATTRGSDGRTLFERLSERYGDRVYAYDHATVGRTVEENARTLLSALPARPAHFDVVCHSRGGLLLRTLVEREADPRFVLGHGVLAGVPNEGSPLAEPDRWEEAVSWVANLLELFPENPFTLGLSFIAEAVVWVAHRAGGSLPGIACLAPGSSTVALLARLGRPEGYACLGASYEPEEDVALRLVDAGIDRFFDAENDLAVPTDGCFRTGPVAPRAVGRFGPGGNLDEAVAIHHMSYFTSARSVDFLAAALEGAPLDAPAPAAGAAAWRKGPVAEAAARAGARASAKPSPAREEGDSVDVDAPERLELLLVGGPEKGAPARLVATLGGARVVTAFETKGGEAGERMRRIIQGHERILGFLAGKPGIRSLPSAAEVAAYGDVLFETLFPANTRRLLDRALSQADGRPLQLVFTSTLDWLADKPWEMLRDPSSGEFLALGNVHLVRNVVTPVPTESPRRRPGPLRLLVAIAQPLGTVPLAVDEEEALVRDGLRSLLSAGLCEVDVVRTLTPEVLHRRLAGAPYDVLHFVGHGQHDAATNTGYLLFEDARGAVRPVDAATLRMLLAGRGLSLVFLNACETGRGGRTEYQKGVAPALVAGGLPAVVANQYSVLDAAAAAFAGTFYWGLARGLSIGASAREARLAIPYAIPDQTMDWAVPVLYAHDASRPIVRPGPGIGRPFSQARAVAPAAGPDRVRVVLWDVNGSLPSLPALAARLQEAQRVFALQAIREPAPLGTWRLVRAGGGRTGFLDGHEIERRVGPRRPALGADHLLCLTGFRVGDDNHDDLVLWDDSVDRAVSLVSLARMAAASPASEDTLRRLIALALLRARFGLSAHEGRRCWLAESADLPALLASGEGLFDARCRRRLASRPAERDALLRLLAGS